MPDRLLTTRELAAWLGVSPETVLRRWRAGELPGFRIASNALRFDPDEVRAWLESRRRGHLVLEDRLDVDQVGAIVISDDGCHRSATLCEWERIADTEWAVGDQPGLEQLPVDDQVVGELAVRDLPHATDRTPPPRLVL
jgi:excisionase family DNA binding protein